MNHEVVVSKIREQLKNYIQKNNIKSLVIGVSGGMDSCLCAALARPVCDANGIPLIGRSLPIISNNSDEIDRAALTGRVFCTDFKEDKILEVYYNRMSSELNIDPIIGYNSGDNLKEWKIRNGNMKTRLRMIYLYNLASTNKGMVLSTDNLTEYLLGFWTLHGDVGDFGMIQELYKSEVYDMAEWLAINECYDNRDAYDALMLTINALATDGLGVTDSGDLGQILPNWKGKSRDGYKEVDRILQVWINMDYLGEKQKETLNLLKDHPVIQRHLSSSFKRNNPYNLKRLTIIKE